MRIWGIITDVFVNKNVVLLRNILISAIPAGIVGYLLADFIDQTPFFGNIAVVMTTLALVGVVMIILDKLPMLSPVASGEKMSPGRALVVGLVQILSLIPGVSRSGSTIIAGRLMGLSPAASAEYSFLVSLPIMLGVTAKVFVKASDRLYFVDHLPMLILSNTIAFISGLLAVGFLMRYLSKHNLAVFGWYRVGLAAVIALILLVQYLMTV